MSVILPDLPRTRKPAKARWRDGIAKMIERSDDEAVADDRAAGLARRQRIAAAQQWQREQRQRPWLRQAGRLR